MNTWKPVNIDNDLNNSLSGLVSIEECTNYDRNILTKAPKATPRINRIGKVVKKGKNKSKQKKKENPQGLLPNKDEAKSSTELSPSKQGNTGIDNFTCMDFSCEQTDDKEINLDAWANLPLQPPLFEALASLKFEQPTAIQSLTLPAAILGKRDILGAAETGSGKTLAFGLPILHGILKLKESLIEENDRNNTDYEIQHNDFNGDIDSNVVKNISQKPLYALILTPTRELAMQVNQHLRDLAKYANIKIAVVIGGMAVEKQQRLLSKGPEIVVATPGRLWELIEEGNGHLSQINNIKYLAIDETDRMLEKGHFQELEKILDKVNADKDRKEQRQNFVFSATLTLVHEIPKYLLMKRKMKFHSKIANLTPSQKLQRIVETLNITNPKVVDITQGSSMPTTLTECKITCTAQEKDFYVYYFLMKHPGRTLIFCNSIGCVRRLVTILSILNCNTVALHSSLHQRQRLKNLDKFKENDNCILIATDVAARGLDISSIQHVIHYQTPRTSESYVHRSGRTARASNEGITILLVEPAEIQQYLRLCRTLGKTEDLPLFPIQENFLEAVRKRINLAREIDKLELMVRKSNSDIGWMQKAAEEMDIILDDDLQNEADENDESHANKRAASIRKKQLQALLEIPIFPKNFSGKYPLGFQNPNAPFLEGERDITAVEVMKNAMEMKNVKRSIKSKHLFKSKIRGTTGEIKLNSFLKKKNPNSKKSFKNNKKGRRNSKRR